LQKVFPVLIPTQHFRPFSAVLSQQGWRLERKDNRFAARKGTAGRVGPLLVHTGLILLMLGAVWGVLAGNRLERFLAPGRTLDLLSRDGDSQYRFSWKPFKWTATLRES
jgi:cytochrome c biogenesis protein